MIRLRADEPHPLILGMVIFIASETMFFAGLFAAYYTLRSLTHHWPPRGVTFSSLGTVSWRVHVPTA